MRKLIVLFLLSCPYFFNAQVLKLSVIDDNSESVFDYFITINTTKKFKNRGELIQNFSVNPSDLIRIEHPEFKSFTFEIPSTVKTTDTLYKVVELNPSIQLFGDVIISAVKYINVDVQKHEFVKDYYPYPNDLLILFTQKGNDFYLKLRSFLIPSSLDSIGVQKGYSNLFRDVMGNFYLVGDKSAQQFNIVDDKIVIQSPMAINEFEGFIEPLIAYCEDYALFELWSGHNQRYSLISKNNEGSKMVYDYFNDEKFKNAVYHYNNTVNHYMATIHEKDNVILMGIWDGDLMTLNEHPNPDLNLDLGSNVSLLRLTLWSDKIASKKMNVFAFDMIEYVVVLNGETNQIEILENQELTLIDSISPDFLLTGNYFYDYFYDLIYMYEKINGVTIIYRLDIEKGKRIQIAELTDIHQPRNIKVINDVVYFYILNENRFNQLIRVK